MKTRSRAFTLVEVVVVIAIVALLSAILVPLVARQIDSAKVSRAQNETLVIAAAIQTFYRDLGLFPAKNGDGADHYQTRLISGTAIYNYTTSTTGIDYGYTSSSNDDWYDDDQDYNDKYVGIFNSHLQENNPESPYATSGDNRWKGPYLGAVGLDPWGRPYVCNIDAAYTGTNRACVVLSAGPNGAFDTAVDPAATVAAPSEDDLWAIVRLR